LTLFRRTPPRLARRALWALAAAYAVSGPAAAADPPDSRTYPPTYSSRKAPWYDPFRLFTNSDKKPVVQASAVTLAAPATGKPVPHPQTVDVPPGASTGPAWKWYGYGTPTPGRNPLAPAGVYGGVPANWYTASGATPGAVPPARPGSPAPALVPDPVPGSRVIHPGPASFAGPTNFAAPDGPAPTAIVSPQADKFAEVDWTPSPSATLKAPTADAVAPTADATPPAKLSAPVRADDGPALGPPVRPTETPPPSPPAESPDIPVEPAKGIILPPNPGPGGMSRAQGPVTARAQAPDADLGDLIRQACGPQVRVMEFSPVGPKHAVLRLATSRDAALAARDRLARVPDLAGWHIEFELVTPLRP
jgi:hypothetical protein